MNRIPAPSMNAGILLLALIVSSSAARAQQAQESRQSSAPPAESAEFNRHLDELTNKLDSMRQQLIESQQEMDELRGELRNLREQLAQKDQSEIAARDADSLRSSVARLQDETEVLQAQVKQHDQTKVESVSKFPVRINGALLITSVYNNSNSDNYNLPVIAIPNVQDTPSGSLSATATQTILGMDASGPHLWGAKSRGDLNVDFWGGVPAANYTGGSLRIRTAHAQLEWPTRSLGVAYDHPLFSPWQPTSWVTVAVPALAWSGNLWAWSPQFEFRQNEILHHLNVELGIIDPPAPTSYTTAPSGEPSATERSHQPGYEARIGSSFSWGDHPFNFGAGGYYSRQAYLYGHHVDAWAGTADWDLAFTHMFRVSGQFYRGRGIGGLGGGTFKDYVTISAEHYLQGLDAEGGWAQAKLTITPSLEVNLSGGLDNAFSADLQGSDQTFGQGWYASLARNQTGIANLVYRPKSYLLLSAEFRQIDSRSIAGRASEDRVFGVSTGYIF